MSARGLLLGFAALLAAAVLLRGGLPPYDDAFFFTRLAANHAAHGVWAWNVADGPVHGSTSQLQQVLVAALHALAPSHTVALGRALAAAALAASAALLGRKAVLPALLGFGAPVAVATVFSGMETATALLIGSAWLVTRRAGPRVLLGVLLYLARPDAALLPAATLALTAAAGPDRRAAAIELAALLAGVALVLVGLHAVYGSALPLSFYLKSGLSDVYGPVFLAKSRAAGLRHLLYFALSAAPLVYIGLHDRAAWRRLAPALAFSAYHALATVDVMGLHGRFYAPCLPWLVSAAVAGWPAVRPRWALAAAWIAVGAAAFLLAAVPTGEGWPIGQVPALAWAGAGLAAVAALWPPARRLVLPALAVSALARPGTPGLPSDVVYAERLARSVTSWRGLDAVRRCLGDDIRVLHSEIGVPGVLLPGAHITDLGGLMTPGPIDAEALCLAQQPEVLFLPHRNYAALNAQLREGRCLEGYVQVVPRSSSPLLVRADLLSAYHCAE